MADDDEFDEQGDKDEDDEAHRNALAVKSSLKRTSDFAITKWGVFVDDSDDGCEESGKDGNDGAVGK